MGLCVLRVLAYANAGSTGSTPREMINRHHRKRSNKSLTTKSAHESHVVGSVMPSSGRARGTGTLNRGGIGGIGGVCEIAGSFTILAETANSTLQSPK